MDNRIIITVFTDPMMGLSYESEPIMDRLREEYAGSIEFRYVMGFLVRDVSDFMLPEELSMAPGPGIKRYCSRLARIYKSEERIGGLPMKMDSFCLFDEDHRSSMPLNLAFHAARLTDPEKAEEFLRTLRHAIVLENRPAAHFDEILSLVRKTGIDEKTFVSCFRGSDAEKALEKDLAFMRSLGIRSLPAYLIQYRERALILQSFVYADFVNALQMLTESKDQAPFYPGLQNE